MTIDEAVQQCHNQYQGQAWFIEAVASVDGHGSPIVLIWSKVGIARQGSIPNSIEGFPVVVEYSGHIAHRGPFM